MVTTITVRNATSAIDAIQSVTTPPIGSSGPMSMKVVGKYTTKQPQLGGIFRVSVVYDEPKWDWAERGR